MIKIRLKVLKKFNFIYLKKNSKLKSFIIKKKKLQKSEYLTLNNKFYNKSKIKGKIAIIKLLQRKIQYY